MGILRRLLGGGYWKNSPREVVHCGSPFLRSRAEKALRALSQVIVPGYDVDLVSSGVVTRVRVGFDGDAIVVFLDYYGSNPGCSFCRFINDTLWRRILGSAREALAGEGFREVVFVDSLTGNPIVVI